MGFKLDIQLQKYISPIFFETGTFLGGGVKTALRNGFNKVVTIELQEYLYNQCINGDPTGNGEDLVEEIKNEQVKIYLGNSKELIPILINQIEDRITFWLDAHIDGGNYRPGITPNINPCPLYEELIAIKNHKRKDHIILIDDLRIIANNDRPGYGWGSNTNLEILKELILDINPNYTFSFEDGEVPNDILVAKLI